MALHLRQGDFREFLNDLDRTQVWGPVHRLLVAAVQFVGGPNYRLAILPSLAGWIATALFACLLVRRIAGPPSVVGALLPVVFILASPAHRAFAADIMLESLGAGLSLLVLYCYVRAVQDTSRTATPLLGVSLTLLFLCKYNYWLLTMIAIVVQELSSGFSRYAAQSRAAVGSPEMRKLLKEALRHPIMLVVAGLASLWLIVVLTGGGEYTLFGQRISMRAPAYVLLTVTYGVFFVHALVTWVRHRATFETLLTDRQLQFVRWHLLPIAVWFAMPRRLGYFFWYVGSPHGANSEGGLLSGASMYAAWIAQHYHVGWWAWAVVALLAGFAVANARRWRRGGLVLVWFVILSALLTCQHANRKDRFVHSWIAGAWVVAGIGLAHAAETQRRSRLLRSAGLASGISAVALLAVLQAPSMLRSATTPDGGATPDQPTTLDWAESYLPDLESSREPVFLSNQPIKFLVWWTYRSHFHERARPDFELNGYGATAEQNRTCFQQWLEQTSCDAVVLIHIPQQSRFHEFTDEAGHEQLRAMLQEQTVFRLARRYQPTQDPLTVSIWRRDRRPAAHARSPEMNASSPDQCEAVVVAK